MSAAAERSPQMDDMPRPVGRPQGGMKSEMGKASYWRMQYESAVGALADLIAENTENVEALRRVVAAADGWVGFDDSHDYGDAILMAVGPAVLNGLPRSNGPVASRPEGVPQ